LIKIIFWKKESLEQRLQLKKMKQLLKILQEYQKMKMINDVLVEFW